MNKKSIASLMMLSIPVLFFSTAQGSDLISFSQQGDNATWQITVTDFTVKEVVLDVVGPPGGWSASAPSYCSQAPFVCRTAFPAGVTPEFSTAGLVPGQYNWEVSIIADTSNVEALCDDTPEGIREAEGGNQGLSGTQGAPSVGEIFIQCMQDSGIIPLDQQELSESGSFFNSTAGSAPPPTPPDNNPPIADAGPDQLLECAGGETAATLDGSGSSDPDNDFLSMSWDGSFGRVFGVNPTVFLGLGTHAISLIVNDGFGGIDTDDLSITIQDTIAPTLTVSNGGVVLEATSVDGADHVIAATADDACGANVSIYPDESLFPLGSTDVTVTATDGGGNSVAETVQVTVVDTTAPVLTVPANVTAEATGDPDSVVAIGSATATDIFQVTITNDAPAGGFPLGSTSVTWTAEDANGNITQDTQLVTVVDTTPPVLTVPADITAEANGNPNSAVAIGSATATDLFTVTITNDAPAGGFSLGGTIVTWTAEDANGNITQDTQLVTVVDITPPVVTAPADVSVEATGSQTAVAIGTATATDVVGVTSITSNAPATFPVGTTVVTWTATDAARNSATATQSVTVVDTTPPVVTAPAGVSVEATGPQTAVAIGTATATDAVGVTSITSNAPATFPVGTTVVIWTATDAAGNSATATQSVTVVDTTPPVVTAPADVSVEATGPQTAVVIGTATATDAVGVISITSNAPATFPVGTTVVTWTATDAAGNFATATQGVTVADTTPPENMACNAQMTIFPSDVPLPFTATATDLTSDPVVTITGYDCHMINGAGKRVDKTQSCVVSYTGDTLSILDSGGVGDIITWSFQAEDAYGNVSTESCEIKVLNPGKGEDTSSDNGHGNSNGKANSEK